MLKKALQIYVIILFFIGKTSSDELVSDLFSSNTFKFQKTQETEY